MRRILNLGVIAFGGLIGALAPCAGALATPLVTFTAAGTGVAAIDDSYGCYAPNSGDDFLLNDNPQMACPTTANGEPADLSCGCILAGSEMPNGGQPVYLFGDLTHGSWKVTELQISFAFFDNLADEYLGSQNGTGNGVSGGRCYAAAGFTVLQSIRPAAHGATAYFELQGTVCDTVPPDPNSDEPYKTSFSGSYYFNPGLSSPYYAGLNGNGSFSISIDTVGSAPTAYTSAQFSFTGFLI